ncbi:hypothetical protein LCGC14_1762420, partial [marine sediment metagenome]
GYKVVPVAANVKAIRKAIQHHFDVASMSKQDIVSLTVEKLRGEDFL